MPSIQELFDLSGRVAIVTGGSRGLGEEMAEGLGTGYRRGISRDERLQLVSILQRLRENLRRMDDSSGGPD